MISLPDYCWKVEEKAYEKKHLLSHRLTK